MRGMRDFSLLTITLKIILLVSYKFLMFKEYLKFITIKQFKLSKMFPKYFRAHVNTLKIL